MSSGISFSGSDLQINGTGYYNAPQTEILFNGGSISIAFTNPTLGFRLDVRDFAGFSATATVAVYAANKTTVLYQTTSLSIADPAVFFGYQYTGGIGLVTLTTTQGDNWSPIIEDVTFAPIPEPSTAGLLALGAGILLIAGFFGSSRRGPAL